MMDIIEKILPTITALGIPAAAIFALYFFTRTKKTEITGAVTNALHNFKQTETEKKIESIETEQTKVIAVIKDTEEVSVQTQKRIRAITDKAAEKIEEVKKADSIKNVQNIIEDNWEDL